jgi:hypothetical protein
MARIRAHLRVASAFEASKEGLVVVFYFNIGLCIVFRYGKAACLDYGQNTIFLESVLCQRQ